MVCPYCGHKTRVTNSRHQHRANQVWRRRLCPACKNLFTTHETLQFGGSHSVINNSGDIEPLNADRLYTEVLLAIQDRKDCYDEARALTATILAKLSKQQTTPIATTDISQTVSGVLKNFNHRAWLRYAAEHPSIRA